MANHQEVLQAHFRVFRPRNNVLDTFSDAELIRHYRLDVADMEFHTELMREYLENPKTRSVKLSTLS